MDYYDTKQICYDLLKKHGWLDYSSEEHMAGRDLRYLEQFLAKAKASRSSRASAHQSPACTGPTAR